MERNDDDQVLPKHQETSSSLLSQNPKLEFIPSASDFPRNHDRLKRDEWSEGAVSSLLEAYEAKWTLRNRAKLKGQDWEDVAKHVSGRANGSKSAKTQTQCKNKIESMKKRYRSESAAGDPSSWPLYPRLDLLLRGNGTGPAAPSASAANPPPPPVVTVELPSSAPPPPAPAVLEQGSIGQDSHGTSGGDRLVKEDGCNHTGAKQSNIQESEKNPIDDTDSTTPAIYAEKENPSRKPCLKGERKGKAMKKRKSREEYWEIGDSIRWLAEVVARSEQARMETMREIERMRAEAEAKRGEMDLKRTEIIASTQLEIAKLFARGSVDSSFKIGRS
ncbi:UNVERIFIED_CONTAM: Trihelix transcription factor ASIL2 [Sesamum angustifolium]|uniref:Trihelix transcription factor ASIL2 n=1 Tax=Sesamum angustifolium TaxID=2727405 RepID=A0AAW2RI93_9LAMI